MICCQHEHYAPTATGDYGFEVDGARIKYGRGILSEVGEAAKALGITRAAVFIDPYLRRQEFVEKALASLREAKVDSETYTDITVEPTDVSFKKAAAFAVNGKFDGYISIGGGSTIDTTKAADLYATYPAEFMEYVNAPIGAGKPVPGPLRPHIACPTTSRDRERVHGHCDLRLSRNERKNGNSRARAASGARNHRPRRHALAAADGRCLQRLRRPQPRARIIYGDAVYASCACRQRRCASAFAGRKSVQ